jgi:predicted metal-dependent hydrolase
MSRGDLIDTPAGPAQLKRSRRKTLAISVLPDGMLELAAPEGASLVAILTRVQKRISWIERQRRHFHALNSLRPQLRYVSGATHRYLGRQYRLKVTHGDRSSVTLRGAYLHVTVSKAGEEGVQQALSDWYRRQAGQQFERRLATWDSWCRRHQLPRPKMRLRSMPKRWGSATSTGVIYLNPELIRAPSPCVDYLIAPDICHLKHHHHGKAFYAELTTLCPDWAIRKRRLECIDL